MKLDITKGIQSKGYDVPFELADAWGEDHWNGDTVAYVRPVSLSGTYMLADETVIVRGIARAVIMQPDMIIADEPVSALDVSIQAQVINLLNDLRHELGLTILFIAHDLSVVKYFSDRIGVMYYGKMVELATSDELFAHPLHPYTKALLSAIPLPDPAYEKNRKRITYNPLAAHDYSVDKPSMREVAPGHFVQCNDKEFAEYQRELKG